MTAHRQAASANSLGQHSKEELLVKLMAHVTKLQLSPKLGACHVSNGAMWLPQRPTLPSLTCSLSGP